MRRIQYFRNSEKNESGFTLVELLVVILIIGILSSIAVPMFLNQRKQALNAQLKSDMKNVATWMENNKVKNPNTIYPRMYKSWYAPDGTQMNHNWPADLPLSKSSGIITSDSGNFQGYYGGSSVRAGNGFCIEGQVLNSDFDLSGTGTGQRLWYSSLKGGFTDTCQM